MSMARTKTGAAGILGLRAGGRHTRSASAASGTFSTKVVVTLSPNSSSAALRPFDAMTAWAVGLTGNLPRVAVHRFMQPWAELLAVEPAAAYGPGAPTPSEPGGLGRPVTRGPRPLLEKKRRRDLHDLQGDGRHRPDADGPYGLRWSVEDSAQVAESGEQ